jgi:hypothetical protein
MSRMASPQAEREASTDSRPRRLVDNEDNGDKVLGGDISRIGLLDRRKSLIVRCFLVRRSTRQTGNTRKPQGRIDCRITVGLPMEQDVYVCTWKRTPDEFILWVKSRPQLRGTGPSYADAEQHLIDAILRLGQTAIPVLEFDPPLPKSDLDSRYADPELYLVCGDDRFEADGPRRTPDETIEERESRFRAWDDYFRSPLCRECSATSSPRSNRPLSLEYAPSRIDGAFGMVGPEGAAPCARVFSGEFLNLLSAEEKRSLEFRPVIWKSRRRQFHELIGPEGPPFVAVAALPVRGWRCWLCGHRTWGYYVESMSINEFVAKSDLPSSTTQPLYCRALAGTTSLRNGRTMEPTGRSERYPWFHKSLAWRRW